MVCGFFFAQTLPLFSTFYVQKTAKLSILKHIFGGKFGGSFLGTSDFLLFSGKIRYKI